MATKKPHVVVSLSAAEAPLINENFDQVYRLKPESLLFNNSGTYCAVGDQEMIHGQISVSAMGLSSVSASVTFDKSYAAVLYADASVLGAPGIGAEINNISSSQMVIHAVARHGSATLLSAATTSSFVVMWQAIVTRE